MKVLMINGSPRANGNTSIALNEMKTVFEKEGVDAEIVQVGSEAVRVCRRSGLFLSGSTLCLPGNIPAQRLP